MHDYNHEDCLEFIPKSLKPDLFQIKGPEE